MARRRFFVREVRRGMAEITGPDAEHLVRVLRVEPGQRFEISDNTNVYLAQVESSRKSLVSFQVVEQIAPKKVQAAVTLSPALFKFDRFEWLIEKATELGVTAIRPFEATRTEHGLGKAAVKRAARWERIALEASEQSRRDHLPRIDPVVRFAKILQSSAPVRLLLDESPDAPPLLHGLPQERAPADSVELLLGPEGGFTEEERSAAIEGGWKPCSLGNTILRAETAGLAGIAIVQGLWQTAR